MDPRGRFYVTVDYDNEIVALGAIRLAERVINALDSKHIAQVDMAREIGRLRELARISRRFSAPAARAPWDAAERRKSGARTLPGRAGRRCRRLTSAVR